MADFYFGETSTPDYGGNWGTYGGGSPTEDKNQSSIFTGGTFTTTASAITITELSRGMEDAASQAGGTVSIGVIDITGGTAGATLLGSATINLLSTNTGNYIWHTVSGLSIAVPQGRTIAIVSGKPTVQVWHTQHASLTSEYQTPATTSLPSTWTATANTARAIPLRGGYSLAASSSVDSYPATVRSGQTGIAYSTTGLSSVSGITVGSLAATSLSDTAGDGTHAIPGLVDGVAHQLYGTKTVTVTGTGGAPTTTTEFLPPVGWDFEPLAGTLNTSETGVLHNFSPAAVVTDQIVFETANGAVDAQGNFIGTPGPPQTMWHIQASTGIARSYLVITSTPATTTATNKITGSKITGSRITGSKITGRNL